MPRSSRRREPARTVGHDVLRRTVRACRRVYRRYPNVIDVTWGLKLRRGRRVKGVECIQFYVRRKPGLRALGRARLPRFVYARRKNGTLDRRLRIPTDVVRLRLVEFACAGGTAVEVGIEKGAVTLVFRNRAEIGKPFYLLTCSHVAGDVRSDAADPIESDCCKAPDSILANPVVNSQQSGGRLAYDVALARLVADCKPKEHAIGDTGDVVTDFMSPGDIRPGMRLSCVLPVSTGLREVVVHSDRAELPVRLDGAWYRVGNLFSARPAPQDGDSGGLLYDDDRAAGIMVARSSDGYGFFQPLQEAFEHVADLAESEGLAVQCF
jgi:hypothetical protein